jgi:hypothetical protein
MYLINVVPHSMLWSSVGPVSLLGIAHCFNSKFHDISTPSDISSASSFNEIKARLARERKIFSVNPRDYNFRVHRHQGK